MVTSDQRGLGWTVVMRRQPVRLVDGRPEGGYTDKFEIVCCDCGDHPDLDYTEVSPRLRRIRGPYLFTDGVAAYVAHVGRYHQPAPAIPRQRMTDPSVDADLAVSGLAEAT